MKKEQAIQIFEQYVTRKITNYQLSKYDNTFDGLMYRINSYIENAKKIKVLCDQKEKELLLDIDEQDRNEVKEMFWVIVKKNILKLWTTHFQ
jgi:hypothetical protein